MLEFFKAHIDRILPLDATDWKAFSTLFREKIIRKGELFSEEGKVTSQLSLLLDGVSRSYYKNKTGVECCKQLFVSKQWMSDYSSLLSGLPARVNVQALTDCRIYVADFSSITALYEKHPKIERLVRLLTEQQYIAKEKREMEMAMMNADERYLAFLKEFPMLENLLPQYQIAFYLNITPSQLSRVRSMTLMVGW
ncbi:MAG: Crp/Fnr family transcriptional regulator [Chitinophagaceae bacterium]|nr:Crp/Fnr family transcriptional regulator [Chitinophagaceae bacterium]